MSGKYKVYAQPAEAAAVVARHLGVELAPTMPRPNADGQYDTEVVLVVDSPAGAHTAIGLVGNQPIAAIVTWRLSAEVSRVLFRLPIPVFSGVIEREQFDAAMDGIWGMEARRQENEQVAELETNFVEAQVVRA